LEVGEKKRKIKRTTFVSKKKKPQKEVFFPEDRRTTGVLEKKPRPASRRGREISE